jgi:hypothetical protein
MSMNARCNHVSEKPENTSTRALRDILGQDRLATTEMYLNLSPEDMIRDFGVNGKLHSGAVTIPLCNYTRNITASMSAR